MLEPDVTLTDFALAAESVVFCVLLIRRRAGDRAVNRLFGALFAALGASSLFGGLWHGVFSGAETVLGRWVWFATMSALALAAAILWHVSAALLPSGPWPPLIRRLAWAQLAVQVFISAVVTDAFLIGMIGMLPAILLLFAVYLGRWRMAPGPRALAGVAGIALAASSGLVIVFDVSLHPRWASADAVYHLLQFVAFWLVFLSVPAVASHPR